MGSRGSRGRDGIQERTDLLPDLDPLKQFPLQQPPNCQWDRKQARRLAPEGGSPKQEGQSFVARKEGPREARAQNSSLMKLLRGRSTQSRMGQSAVELLASKTEGRPSVPASGASPRQTFRIGRPRPDILKAGMDTSVLRSILQISKRTPSLLRVWVLRQSDALLGVHSH